MDVSSRRIPAAAAAAALLVASACGDGRESDASSVPDSVPVVENDATGAVDLDSAWSVSVEVRIGRRTGGGPESFGSAADLDVDDLGRVWALDRQANEVRVFGPEGGFVRRVGGEGEGPGEFTDPIGVDRSPEGRMWVVDPGNSRISVFDTAGRYVAGHRRITGGRSGYSMAWRGGFDAEGRYWDIIPTAMGEWSWLVIRPGSTLVAVDTVPVPERAGGREHFEWTSGGGRYRYSVPFTPAASWDVTREGARVMSPGSPYELRWLAADGTTLRIARRPWDPVPLSEADHEQARERLQQIRSQGGDPDPSRIPDHKPAVQSLFLDPSGRVWVDTYGREERLADRTFDIFAPDGRYLGPFTLPVAIRTRPRPVFRGDRVYAVHEDEVGVDHVVVLRLDRPSADAP